MRGLCARSRRRRGRGRGRGRLRGLRPRNGRRAWRHVAVAVRFDVPFCLAVALAAQLDADLAHLTLVLKLQDVRAGTNHGAREPNDAPRPDVLRTHRAP